MRWYMWPPFLWLGAIGVLLREKQVDAVFNDVEARPQLVKSPAQHENPLRSQGP